MSRNHYLHSRVIEIAFNKGHFVSRWKRGSMCFLPATLLLVIEKAVTTKVSSPSQLTAEVTVGEELESRCSLYNVKRDRDPLWGKIGANSPPLLPLGQLDISGK